MEELYQRYERGEISWMPAWWQNEKAARLIGEYNDILFFEIDGLVVMDEHIPKQICYLSKKESEFDKRMYWKSRALQRKRSRR